MKKLLLKSIFICVIAFSITSCEKASVLPTESSTTSVNADIVVRNGHLVFKDRSTYLATIEHLLNHQNELSNWDAQFSNFTSYTKKYTQITETDIQKMAEKKSIEGYENILSLEKEKDGTLQIVKNIENPIFAHIANDAGIVQIGDTYTKFLHNHILTSNVAETSLAEMNIANENVALGKIKVNPIERKVIEADRSLSSQVSYTHGGLTKRIIAQIWVDRIFNWNNLKYEEVYVNASIKHQKKVLGVWYSTNADDMRFHTTLNASHWVGFKVNNVPNPFADSFTYDSMNQDGKSSVAENLIGRVISGANVDVHHGNFSLENSAFCNDNQYRFIYTSANF